ncbi:flagellar basal body rod protein FlgB [Agathobacter sp.]
MINSTSFDYINLLTKAADASWKRESVISNNIANVDTPGYKRKDLDFEGVLTEEIGRCKHESLDSKVSELDMSKLNPTVYTDSSTYAYRMDGNNVDIDTENVELASEQIKYEGLTSSISSQFERMKSVIS